MQLLRSMAGLALLTAALVTNLEVALADSNGPPVVVPGGPYTAQMGTSVLLDASASSDPDVASGDFITTYTWNLNAGGIISSNGPTSVVSAAAVQELGVGTYTFNLKATDTHGASSTASFMLAVTAADLVIRDYRSAGDQWLVRDPQTGLEWLSPRATSGVSYNEVVAGYSGFTTTDGFSVASGEQVQALIGHTYGLI